VQALTPFQTGIRFIPSSVGAAVGSMTAGLLMRTTGKYYWLNSAVQTGMVVSVVLIAVLFRAGLPAWPPFLILLLHGTCYGAMLTVTLLALLAAVGHEHQAVITSASYAFRSTGSTIGITVASAVFQNILKSGLWARFGDYPDAERIIGRVRDDVDEVNRLGPKWRGEVRNAYEEALNGVWVVVLVLAVAGAVSSLFMREHVLHKKLDRN